MKPEKFNQKIMVVDRAKLFGEDHFEGFSDKIDFSKRIIENFEYTKRGLAEISKTLKQPIGYAVIINKKLKKIFAYQRATSTEHAQEARLHGKWSIGVGGHIDESEKSAENPIYASMLREINEEVIINGSHDIKLLGYINYEGTPVDSVHFGVLHVIEVDTEDVFPADKEIASGGLMSIEELDSIFKEQDEKTEWWTKFAFKAVKDYLK